MLSPLVVTSNAVHHVRVAFSFIREHQRHACLHTEHWVIMQLSTQSYTTATGNTALHRSSNPLLPLVNSAHSFSPVQDYKLDKEEILKHYDTFVGSQATEFGESLYRHDEF